MELSCIEKLAQRSEADLLILPFWQSKKKSAEKAFNEKDFDALFSEAISSGDFTGEEGQTQLLYSEGKGKERRYLLLGLGAQDKCVDEVLRRAASAAVKEARKKKCKRVHLLLPQRKKNSALLPLCEGMLLTNYAFDELKREVLKESPTFLISKIGFIGAKKSDEAAVKRIAETVAGVNLTRDLINNNADTITPQALAEQAKQLGKKFPKVRVKIFGKKEIEKKKMGLLLAVNQGSATDPVLAVMEYRGNPQSKDVTAIVGKGITYDTGGLNLKPTGSMETMKEDMSGAAVVIGSMYAAAALKLKVNLIAVFASTENAIGPKAYKPGDVFISYLGKSVEINNTDAEGRLILADAIAYTVKELKPTRIINFATLTGAILVALGEEASGLFSNNDALARQLEEAGAVTGERLWRLPLFAEYREELKSVIADMKNCGSRKAGSITAAKFLQEFVQECPWAHLDIAGTAFREAKYYNTTQASGVGVRLVVQLLEKLAK